MPKTIGRKSFPAAGDTDKFSYLEVSCLCFFHTAGFWAPGDSQPSQARSSPARATKSTSHYRASQQPEIPLTAHARHGQGFNLFGFVGLGFKDMPWKTPALGGVIFGCIMDMSAFLQEVISLQLHRTGVSIHLKRCLIL